MSRKRLFFCVSRFPYPVISGDRIRVFNIIKQLSKEYSITLCSLGSPSVEYIESLKSMCYVDEVICVPHGRVHMIVGLIKSIINRLPFQVGFFDSAQMSRIVGERINEFDICIFHLIRTSGLFPNATAVPSILEMCDAISENYAQTAKEGSWWSFWRLISYLEAPRALRYEKNECKRFDLISIHTRRDADVVGIPENKILISTQGVNINGIKYITPLKRNGNVIVLIGKIDYFPNRNGAEWFGMNVLPRLPKDIMLKVVGDCSDTTKRYLEKIPRLIVTGRVESLEEACCDAFAAIAPMKVATGIQNKVLEYFAMGIPTVTSISVARGLLLSSKGGYYVANHPDEWVLALTEIKNNPQKAEIMAAKAYEYVIREHDWNYIGDEYLKKINLLIKNKNKL